MARFLLHGIDGAPTEIKLKPGVNRFGRNPDNDHQINDASVSSFHCEVTLGDDAIHVRDLGSTNGTFLDAAPIQSSTLQAGQVLRLGSVPMTFQPENGATLSVPTLPQIRLAGLPATPAPTAEVEIEALAPAASGGPDDCHIHAGVLATLHCQRCGRQLCSSCSKSQRVGMKHLHSCTVCGGVCISLKEHRQTLAKLAKQRASFFSLLPGTFSYPFKGNGPIILITGTIFFTLLKWLSIIAGVGRGIGFGYSAALILLVISVGYLFAYMQGIVTSSINGDDSIPAWPEFSSFYEDMLLPFLRFSAILIISVGPGFMIMATTGSMMLGLFTLLLGLLCLPMALLAVALADSLSGLNPLLLFSSISKIPGQYLAACGVLLAILGARTLSEMVLGFLPIPLLPTVVTTFVALYGLTVEMRILGLLYYTNERHLGWFR